MKDILVCTRHQNLRKHIHTYKEEIMLSCSIQNVLRSFLLSRHIHSIFTASVHNLNPHNILKLIMIPSFSEKGEGLGKWAYWTIFMASP